LGRGLATDRSAPKPGPATGTLAKPTHERDTEPSRGIHERQPAGSEHPVVRRHWFTAAVEHDTSGTVNVLNLVEGAAAVVESPADAFEPMTVHYAETFVVPAVVGAYRVRPLEAAPPGRLATIKAYVRPPVPRLANIQP
jgi:hypothetical protein